MRSAVSQANKTFDNSTNAAAGYGAAGNTINSQLTPFLLQQMQNPQGRSQGDLTAMLSSSLGSTGGATSAITGQAEQQAGRTRNDAGFTSALTEAARDREKNLAGTSEGIAADNSNLKEDQRTNAQKMLASLYGTDVNAQQGQTGQANQATQNAIAGSQTGWLQQMQGLLNSVGSLGGGAGAALTGWGKRNG
jgi:hypothetical protein